MHSVWAKLIILATPLKTSLCCFIKFRVISMVCLPFLRFSLNKFNYLYSWGVIVSVKCHWQPCLLNKMHTRQCWSFQNGDFAGFAKVGKIVGAQPSHKYYAVTFLMHFCCFLFYPHKEEEEISIVLAMLIVFRPSLLLNFIWNMPPTKERQWHGKQNTVRTYTT